MEHTRDSYPNVATSIERALTEDGHRTWGFVVYRCAYSAHSETAWRRLLDALTKYTRETLTPYPNGATVLAKFTLTTIQDRGTLDGATADAVRAHFKAWSDAAIEREQPDNRGGVRVEGEDNGDKHGNLPTQAPRYRFCIRASQEVLDCFDGDDDDDDEGRFVDLIQRDWVPDTPHVDRRTGRVYDDAMEPVEGCDRRDVGWMRVSARSVMLLMYDALRGSNDWHLFYRRPYEAVD